MNHKYLHFRRFRFDYHNLTSGLLHLRMFLIVPRRLPVAFSLFDFSEIVSSDFFSTFATLYDEQRRKYLRDYS